MCGVLLSTDVSLNGTEQWSRAMEAIECRGPDSCGQSQVGNLAFGHTRLQIIGLGSVGAQPYQERGKQGVLVYNGEIYNYRELATRVGLQAPESDTEVLFEILQSSRVELLDELRGMFAFVYWDSVAERLVSARDPLGIKPLFVHYSSDGHVSFASVASALARLHGAVKPDATSLAGFLAMGFFPSGSSAFHNIEKIEPGDLSFWTRSDKSWSRHSRKLTQEEPFALPVDQAITDSVAAHMVADVPVGVLMSGGVDSTLIAAIAKSHAEELRTYSITNPLYPGLDEARFAAWNSTKLGTLHTEVPVTPPDLAGKSQGLLLSSGEPFGDPAYLPLAIVCERASQDLKVVMAGEGADELFGGYRRYDVESRLYGHAGPALRGVSRAIGGLATYQRSRPNERVRTIAALSQGPGLLSHSLLLGGEWVTVLSALPHFGAVAWQLAQQSWHDLDVFEDAQRMPSYRAFDFRKWLPNVYLEKSDRASMLSGLEVRVPFIDRVVVRAAMDYQAKDSTKRPLREFLHVLLPEVRLPRRKKGLAVATAALMDQRDFSTALDRGLSGRGLLGTFPGVELGLLARRSALAPGLAFRIAIVEMWADLWGVDSID